MLKNGQCDMWEVGFQCMTHTTNAAAKQKEEEGGKDDS
jgi:hypothetical protein